MPTDAAVSKMPSLLRLLRCTACFQAYAEVDDVSCEQKGPCPGGEAAYPQQAQRGQRGDQVGCSVANKGPTVRHNEVVTCRKDNSRKNDANDEQTASKSGTTKKGARAGVSQGANR